MTLMTDYSSLVLVLLCLYNLSFSDALNGGFSVEIIHRDSPKSPFYNSSETQFQRFANALHRSIIHVNHLNKSFVSQNTPQRPVTKAFGEYLISYSVGTPPLQLYAILDMGSEITWLQCQPCESCYDQDTPIFDPSKSKTYKTIPCTTYLCRFAPRASCSTATSNCVYTILAIGIQSEGDLVSETLTFNSTNGSPIHFPGLAIGCGHKNLISFRGGNSGIVGLGRGPLSLLNQLVPSIGGKFSYCLISQTLQSTVSSKLNFGDAAVVSGHGTVSTPLYAHNGKPFYYLQLEAISVRGNRIEFGNSSSSTPGEKGNIRIDSGISLTFLPNDVYSKFESAVSDAIAGQRTEDPTHVLRLCYKAEELDVPLITAHFSGADVFLSALNIFFPARDGVLCFAFLPSDNAIFGGWAQQNILVGYDLQQKTVSFKLADCTKQ